MIKVMFGWRDRPGMTAAACEAYYRAHHMALARSCFDGVDGFIALVYDRVIRHSVNDFNNPGLRDVTPDFDALCELYFRDDESLQLAFARPVMQKMFDDHVNFMDTAIESNIRVYRVAETVFYGERPQ
jgi:uncharacterized protein (TIGR02118 family)